MLKLYKEDDSYFWTDRKELLEACDVLKDKNLHIDCELLSGFL